MSFNWREFLDLAKYLKEKESSQYTKQSALRTSASRAYFAAYCQARNYASKKLGYTPGPNPSTDHGNLRRFYNNKQRFQIAHNLDDLRRWRNQCDYDESIDALENLAKSSIKKAEYILSKTSNI